MIICHIILYHMITLYHNMSYYRATWARRAVVRELAPAAPREKATGASDATVRSGAARRSDKRGGSGSFRKTNGGGNKKGRRGPVHAARGATASRAATATAHARARAPRETSP